MFGLSVVALTAALVTNVPFELVDNRIVVQARVNGSGPLSMIVDTGSSGTTLTPQAARRLHIATKFAGYIGGAGGGRSAAFSAELGNVSVGSMKFRHLPVLVVNMDTIRRNIGFPRLDGIIGYDCLRRLRTRVDMDHDILTLSTGTLSAPRSARVVPFTVSDTLIHVPAAIDGVVGSVFLDTGDRSSLTLFKTFAAQHRFYDSTPAVRGALTGFGIGGPVYSDVFRTHLSVFGTDVANVVTRASRDRAGVFANSPEAGSIGTGVLKRFNVIYDYPQQTMTVWPSRYFAIGERYDPAGMWLSESGDDAVVTAVTNGGPAQRAGIIAHDTIVSVADVPAHSTVLQLREWFARQPDGTRVAIATRDTSGKVTHHELILADPTLTMNVDGTPCQNEQRTPPRHPEPCRRTLPRHAVFGASVVMKPAGVTAGTVFPQSPAAKGGVLAGDVIKSIAGIPVPDIATFLATIHESHANQDVAVNVVRNNSPLVLHVHLAPALDEQDPAVETIYGAIDVDNSLRRTLVTVPRNATSPRPGVLFIGGIGCYSVDAAANAQDAYLRLSHDLSRAGFATMRVEKSGVGDSQGPPCRDVDFAAESRGYAAALDAFEHDSHVDPNRVYLFGHSIGSVIAPRLALQNRIAGVIVAEAVGRDWPEYELRNTRRQLELGATPPADVDENLLQKSICMQRLLIEKQPEAQIERTMPECKVPNGVYPVTAAYVQEVAQLNIIQPWTRIDRPVLVIYGASDFVTEEADHRRITDVVNNAHAGNATLKIIDGMDHHLGVAASPKLAYDNAQSGKPEPYDTDLSQTIITWLRLLSS